MRAKFKTQDDNILVKNGIFFNYYTRLEKIKISQKGQFEISLLKTRDISFIPNSDKGDIALYGIYTNGCIFFYKDLKKSDQNKLELFYPELKRWLITMRSFKAKKGVTK